MLLPVLAMMLACLGFRGCWPIPRSIPVSGRLMEEKAEMSTQYYLRFGQPRGAGGGRPSGGRCVPAVLLPAGEWVPAEHKAGRSRRSPKFFLKFCPIPLHRLLLE